MTPVPKPTAALPRASLSGAYRRHTRRARQRGGSPPETKFCTQEPSRNSGKDDRAARQRRAPITPRTRSSTNSPDSQEIPPVALPPAMALSLRASQLYRSLHVPRTGLWRAARIWHALSAPRVDTPPCHDAKSYMHLECSVCDIKTPCGFRRTGNTGLRFGANRSPMLWNRQVLPPLRSPPLRPMPLRQQPLL